MIALFLRRRVCDIVFYVMLYEMFVAKIIIWTYKT